MQEISVFLFIVQINFEPYKKQAPSMAAVVDDFASKYSQVKVDYPSGADQLAAIDKQQKESVS